MFDSPKKEFHLGENLNRSQGWEASERDVMPAVGFGYWQQEIAAMRALIPRRLGRHSSEVREQRVESANPREPRCWGQMRERQQN